MSLHISFDSNANREMNVDETFGVKLAERINQPQKSWIPQKFRKMSQRQRQENCFQDQDEITTHNTLASVRRFMAKIHCQVQERCSEVNWETVGKVLRNHWTISSCIKCEKVKVVCNGKTRKGEVRLNRLKNWNEIDWRFWKTTDTRGQKLPKCVMKIKKSKISLTEPIWIGSFLDNR